MCSVNLEIGINILTFTCCSFVTSINDCITPIFSCLTRAFVVGNISNISFAADFRIFKYSFCAFVEFLTNVFTHPFCKFRLSQIHSNLPHLRYIYDLSYKKGKRENNQMDIVV